MLCLSFLSLSDDVRNRRVVAIGLIAIWSPEEGGTAALSRRTPTRRPTGHTHTCIHNFTPSQKPRAAAHAWTHKHVYTHTHTHASERAGTNLSNVQALPPTLSTRCSPSAHCASLFQNVPRLTSVLSVAVTERTGTHPYRPANSLAWIRL